MLRGDNRWLCSWRGSVNTPLSSAARMSVKVSSSPPSWLTVDSLLQHMPTPSSAVGGPLPTESRQGRQKQRYGETGERLVAGCIPVRCNGKFGADGVEVLLITSRGGKGWVFPKGGWEDDETVEAAAKRETVEEAGVRGNLEVPILGTFSFQSGKEERVHKSHAGRCTAYMYVMHVAEELEVWPESQDRQRMWCSLVDATLKCRHEWMREALFAWARRNGWDHMALRVAEVQRYDSSTSESSRFEQRAQ